MSSYSDKLRDPRWQRKRLEILQRDDFRCHECSRSTETLHVHHTRYQRGVEPWDHPSALLITLCHHCHEEMHAGGITGSESFLVSLIERGGDAHVLWSLSVALDFLATPDVKINSDEWKFAIEAFRSSLEQTIESRGRM